MPAIETENLRKEYGDVVAVEGLNLTVERGELFSLLGVNGAGKTTTIKMLTGLTCPTSGDARLNGKSILKEPGAVKAMIAVSPQETAVAPGLSVRENLELICGAYGWSGRTQNRKIDELAKQLGLDEICNRKAGRLSGGWQRRLSIAMALVSEPEILFLDEPTLGLDVLAKREIWNVIEALKGNVTIILTTHNLEEAEALSDRIGIMKQGRMLICDTAAKIKERTGMDTLEKAFVCLVKENET